MNKWINVTYTTLSHQLDEELKSVSKCLLHGKCRRRVRWRRTEVTSWKKKLKRLHQETSSLVWGRLGFASARRPIPHPDICPGEDRVYMYMGVSWPVRSLNMAAGMVFMWIWEKRKDRTLSQSKCKTKGVCCVCEKQRVREREWDTDLAHRVGQGLDDLLMCCGHHTLPVDLDDPVTHTDSTSLGDASAHQTAYLANTHTHTQVRLNTGSNKWVLL